MGGSVYPRVPIGRLLGREGVYLLEDDVPSAIPEPELLEERKEA